MPESPSEDLRDLLALHLVPGLGPKLTAALLQRFGTPRGVLKATSAELRSVPHIGPKIAQALNQAFQSDGVQAELDRMAAKQVMLLQLGTPSYPASVAEIHDPPHLLYLRGTLLAQDARSIAVVGSRGCTPYGKRVAERLGMELARAGHTVVSGLARGIDGMAHRGALRAGGRTIAVLAGGLSRIYPPEHTELAEEIVASGGLITEANMEMEPMAGMFPARNRIISGLSRAIVIVEAAEQSGALITARHAAEQGRQVFAVPGPVDSAASAGVLRLIREGATMVRGADDILEDLEGLPGAAPASPASPPPTLAGEALQVWETLAARPRHADEIAQELNLSAPKLSSILLTLEMQKIVRRLPGNYYERS